MRNLMFIIMSVLGILPSYSNDVVDGFNKIVTHYLQEQGIEYQKTDDIIEWKKGDTQYLAGVIMDFPNMPVYNIVSTGYIGSEQKLEKEELYRIAMFLQTKIPFVRIMLSFVQAGDMATFMPEKKLSYDDIVDCHYTISITNFIQDPKNLTKVLPDLMTYIETATKKFLQYANEE